MPTAAHLSARSSANSLASATRLWVAALFFSGSIAAAGLNDTGFTTCADAAGATVSCTAASAVPGQDARYGRDAAAGTSALTKVGGGANGFDFTKISNAGAVLPATAPLGTAAGDWGCTYDNTTGLTWEVKTASGPRGYTNTYAWYSTNSSTNGGGVGFTGAGGCPIAGRCNTDAYLQDVNATNMCGHDDWRMPTLREVFGLMRVGSSIDAGYFPQSYPFFNSRFWSGSTYVSDPGSAYVVYSDGTIATQSKTQSSGNNFQYGLVRLVRVGR